MLNMSEARSHIHAAEKALKLNYWSFKFKPDFDTAATEYVYAAESFQKIGQNIRAVEAYVLGADSRKKNKDVFGAGRLYENAATTSITSCKDFDGACRYLECAADCYLQARKTESAARAWLKLVEVADKNLPVEAGIVRVVDAYEKCCHIYEFEEKDYLLVDVLKDYSSYRTRKMIEKKATKSSDDFNNAMAVYNKLLSVQLRLSQHSAYAKIVLCKFVLCLWRSDPYRASAELENDIQLNPAINNGKEVYQADVILTTWGNPQELRNALDASVIKYLPLEIAHVARRITCPPGVLFSKKSSRTMEQELLEADDDIDADSLLM